MNRDRRLRGLSTDHHHALVFARKLARRAKEDALDYELIGELSSHWERDLLPHFLIEEQLLLPALLAAREFALVQRTEQDHLVLRRVVAMIVGGDITQIPVFTELLCAHVRFEEREVLAVCQEKLTQAVLDEVSCRTDCLFTTC